MGHHRRNGLVQRRFMQPGRTKAPARLSLPLQDLLTIASSAFTGNSGTFLPEVVARHGSSDAHYQGWVCKCSSYSLAAIPSNAVKTSCGRVRLALSMFCRRCSTEDVPGINRMLGERCNSHARATCIEVAPHRSAA